MVSADRGWLNAADCYFRESRALAERVGDVYLRGLCLVNHAELDATRQRFEDARQKAEEALAVFDQLGVKSAKVDAPRLAVHPAAHPIGPSLGALHHADPPIGL